MKILLVDPVGVTFGPAPALAYIGAFLKTKGYSVKGLDLSDFRGNPYKREREVIEEYRPDIIGFSVLYSNYNWVKENSKYLKSFYQGKIVLGGPQITAEKEMVLNDIPEVDYLVVGEGEEAMDELCQGIEGNFLFKDIKGLVYRNGNGSIVSNPIRPLFKEIDNLPFPDFSIFDVKELLYYPIMSSRGCPYNCTYCFRQFKNDWRPRKPENVIREIEEAIGKYSFPEACFHDDSFNVNPQRVIDICNLMIQKGIKIKWSCAGIRGDRITDEMAAKMNQTGCYRVSVGVESLVPEIFDTLNKKESINDILSGIRILQKNRIEVESNFIIGLPGDTYSRTIYTFKKAFELGLKEQSWTLLLPLPGTKMWRMLYDDPSVKRLDNYKEIDMIWHPKLSRVKTAFERPEYNVKEKLRAYHRINVKLGNPKYIVFNNPLLSIFSLFWTIVRYDAFSLPKCFLKIAKKFIRKIFRDPLFFRKLKKYIRQV